MSEGAAPPFFHLCSLDPGMGEEHVVDSLRPIKQRVYNFPNCVEA